jgi:dihydrofolate reductase/thymidylate synthase
MKINVIMCLSNDSILGVNNDLYVKIGEDLKYFKRITSDNYYKDKPNVLIMGYNTYKSIGKPLPNRLNIVISRNHQNELDDLSITNFPSFDDVLQYLEYKDDIGKIFIIGGASIYLDVFKNYLPLIDNVYLTKVHTPQLSDMQYLKSVNKATYCNISLNDYINSKKLIHLHTKKCTGNTTIYDFDTDMYIHKTLDYSFDVYQSCNTINNDELQYLNLLQQILSENNIKSTRNADVYSKFGTRMEFDLRKGFPILTTKRVPWKTVLRELLWFISGSTDNRILKDKKVNIWNANASREFLDSRGLNYCEDDLGPVYGFQWRHFGAEYVDYDTDYTGKGVDQLRNIINEIIDNPTSRRLILNSWNAMDIDKMALPPCHVMVQFNIDNGFIDCQLYQRSGDMFLGVPFNITSYAFLLHIVGHLTNYVPRKLVHIIGDAHIYSQHLDAVQRQLFRTPNPFPQLTISGELHDIDDIDENVFQIVGYDCYSTIPAPMIA